MNNIILIETVELITEIRKEINSINIMDAEFVKDGETIIVSQEDRENFKFTGLSTIDFVNSNYGNNF